MDIKERLQKETKHRLKKLARQLKLDEHSNKRKQELIDLIIYNRFQEEIIAGLEALNAKVPWWKWIAEWQVLVIIVVLGSIASLLGIVIVMHSYQISKESPKNQDKISSEKKDQYDPTKREQTIKEFQNKIKELQKALEDEKAGNPKERIEALNALKNGNAGKALEFFTQRIKMGTKNYANDYYNQGNAYLVMFKYKKALSAYLEAERLAPGNKLYLNNVGGIYDILANHKKASEYYEKARESDLKTCENQNPAMAIRWNNLGCESYSLGEYQKAIGYFEKALEIDLKIYGDQHPRVATYWNNLGRAWKALGEYKKAIGYYEQALESDLKTYGNQHPSVAIIWNNLGSAWKALGEYKKAIGYYEQALESDLKTYGNQHPSVAIDWNNLGVAWYLLGEYQKAVDYAQKALTVFEKFLDPNHPNTKTAKNNLEYYESKLKAKE